MNHEFDHMVSHELFKTVVVPFRPELYGMLKVSRTSPVKPNIKGKAKAQVGPNKDEGDLVNDALHNLYWAKAKGGSLHDGMKVFQGFGRHIRKFGMSFEVDEGELIYYPSLKLVFCVDDLAARPLGGTSSTVWISFSKLESLTKTCANRYAIQSSRETQTRTPSVILGRIPLASAGV